MIGIDIADLGTPRLTWRRLHSLIRRLPASSELATELGALSWSRTDQLLRLVLFTFQSAFWSGKGRPPEPIPMDDPHSRAVVGPTPTARAALARWRNGDITPQ